MGVRTNDDNLGLWPILGRIHTNVLMCIQAGMGLKIRIRRAAFLLMFALQAITLLSPAGHPAPRDASHFVGAGAGMGPHLAGILGASPTLEDCRIDGLRATTCPEFPMRQGRSLYSASGKRSATRGIGVQSGIALKVQFIVFSPGHAVWG